MTKSSGHYETALGKLSEASKAIAERRAEMAAAVARHVAYSDLLAKEAQTTKATPSQT